MARPLSRLGVYTDQDLYDSYVDLVFTQQYSLRAASRACGIAKSTGERIYWIERKRRILKADKKKQ